MTNQNQNIGPEGTGIQIAGDVGNLTIKGGTVEKAVGLSDVPPPLKHWQERDEFGAVQKLLKGTPLVGVYGPGGAGKSTIAARVFEGWQGRKLWVNLFAVPSFDTVARRGLRQLGGWSVEQAEREEDVLERLAGVLREGSGLLVLDNFESVEPEVELSGRFGDFVKRWTAVGGKGRMLVTSRVRGELRASGLGWVSVADGLTVDQGRSLLQELGVQGSGEELGAFVERAAGYPLVLTLAAGWLRDCRPDGGHVSLLSEEVFAIEGLHRGAEEVSVEGVLRQGYDRLTEDQRRVLGLVSAFRRSFVGRLFDGETYEILQGLARRAFLIQTGQGEEDLVFSWQPVVKGFVESRVADTQGPLKLALAYYSDVQRAGPGKWRTKGETEDFIEYSYFKGELAKSLLDWDVEASSLLDMGNAYQFLGEHHHGLNCHEQSLAIYRERGDRLGAAKCLNGLGGGYHLLRKHLRAVDYHKEALTIYREIGDRYGEGLCLSNLGCEYSSLEDYDQATDYHEKSLAIFREISDRDGEAVCLGNLGNTYSIQGQQHNAIYHYRQSLAIKREVGDLFGQAASLNGLGLAWAKLNRKWEAKESYIAARDIFAKLGLDHMVKQVENNLRQVLQAIPAPTETIRAPQIGEPRQPEPWELERFDQPSPRPKPKKSRRRKPKALPWWRRLLRPLKRLIHKLLNP